ncbi:MAG: hypothetical protein AB1490_14850 [Pseudomonadota bacterium]
MTQMPPGPLAAKHGGNEQALIDLETRLLALQKTVFGGYVLRGGDKTGQKFRRSDAQLFQAHEARSFGGERIIDGIDVCTQKESSRLDF